MFCGFAGKAATLRAKLRSWLRDMDLKDLQSGRPPVQKTQLKERVKRLLRSEAARVAKNIFASWHTKAAAVKKARGGAIRGQRDCQCELSLNTTLVIHRLCYESV